MLWVPRGEAMRRPSHFQVPGKARITPLFIDMEKDPPRVTWGGPWEGQNLNLGL